MNNISHILKNLLGKFIPAGKRIAGVPFEEF